MTWRSARDMVSVASNAQSNSLVFFGAIALEEALVWVTAPQDKVRNGNTLGAMGCCGMRPTIRANPFMEYS